MKQKHRGSKLEDLLDENGFLEACRAEAIQFKVEQGIEQASATRRIGKAKNVRRLKVRQSGLSR